MAKTTYNYAYRKGRKICHHGIAGDLPRRNPRRERLGGEPMGDGKANTRSNALDTENRQAMTRGYYA